MSTWLMQFLCHNSDKLVACRSIRCALPLRSFDSSLSPSFFVFFLFVCSFFFFRFFLSVLFRPFFFTCSGVQVRLRHTKCVTPKQRHERFHTFNPDQTLPIYIRLDFTVFYLCAVDISPAYSAVLAPPRRLTGLLISEGTDLTDI